MRRHAGKLAAGARPLQHPAPVTAHRARGVGTDMSLRHLPPFGGPLRSVPLAAALIAIAVACTDATGPAPAPAGCYQLTLGGWNGEFEATPPTARLVLLDSLGEEVFERGQRLVRAWPSRQPPNGYWAWWSQPTPDSLRVNFSHGFVGITLALRWRDGAAWYGEAHAFTDTPGHGEATGVGQLTPLPCE